MSEPPFKQQVLIMTRSGAIDKIALLWPIRIIPAILTATMIVMPVDGPRAQTNFCKCDDLNTVKAAVINFDGWVHELYGVLTDPALLSVDLDAPYSEDEWNQIDKWVSLHVDVLPTYPTNFSSKNWKSNTEWPTCKVQLPEGVGTCVRQMAAEHENVHSGFCQAKKGDVSQVSMRQVIEDEIRSYVAGWQFARAQMRKLECTCPYYALELQGSLKYQNPTPAVAAVANSADTGTIPLKFQDDGSYTGQGRMPFAGTGNSPGCTGQANWSRTTSIKGTVDGGEDSPQTHIDISMGLASGQGTMKCPSLGLDISIPIGGGNTTAAGKGHLDMSAVVGSHDKVAGPQIPGLSSGFTATIVETPAKEKLTEADRKAQWRLGRRGYGPIPPDALPNCKGVR